jgi:hypothetical protein
VLKAFVHAAEKAFNGVARFKNMFTFDEARAERQLHYRTFMINVVWPPTEGDFPRTFKELSDLSTPIWDEYCETMPTCSTFQPSRWSIQCEQARGHLQQLADNGTPLHFICEIQVLLQPYLDGRKSTHTMYKILRSETDYALYADFAVSKKMAEAGMKFSDIQATCLSDMKKELALGKEKTLLLLKHTRDGNDRAVSALVAAGAIIYTGLNRA